MVQNHTLDPGDTCEKGTVYQVESLKHGMMHWPLLPFSSFLFSSLFPLNQCMLHTHISPIRPFLSVKKPFLGHLAGSVSRAWDA